LIVPALLGSAAGFSPAAGMAAEKVLDRTFQVAPGGQLVVRADGADIAVTGGDTDKVVVHMVARGAQKSLDQFDLKAEQAGGRVTVEMLRRERSSWGWNDFDGEITVTVPRTYRVDADTSGGDVEMKTLAGPSRIRTSGGDLIATGIQGDLDAGTSGGDVRLDSIDGKVRGHTSGGDIRATGVRGEVDVETSGGDVQLVRIDGGIRAHTSGGDVTCELIGANRGISASTSGGSVRLRLPKGIKGELNAESGGGSIRSDFPVESTRSAEHRLDGRINGGGERIYVHTSGGSITLNVAGSSDGG
jgi:DUF4097 and DUF4098 domain-containing protein YvlB